jgi:hypothetical protein
MKKQIPQIKYSNLKSITSYVADLQGDEKAFKILKNVGKKVITEEEYIMIGFSYINTFESLGREHITKEQFINIGFNYALIKGLGEAKKVKSKKK